MHIPDGFLSAEVWVGMWLATLAVLAFAFMRANRLLGDKHVPLMGVLAAFVFAAQMLNAPVAGGTSGHMLGGVMAAALVGPMAASIVMAAVFFMQALIFHDGGITALGANIFNMGLIGAILGYYVYVGIRRVVGGDIGMFAGLAIAGWLSLVLASFATAAEIGISGIVPMGVVVPAMVGVHVVIGVIEAGATVAVIGFIKKTRPDLLELKKV